MASLPLASGLIDVFEVGMDGPLVAFNVTRNAVTNVVGKIEVIANRCPFTPEKIDRDPEQYLTLPVIDVAIGQGS